MGQREATLLACFSLFMADAKQAAYEIRKAISKGDGIQGINIRSLAAVKNRFLASQQRSDLFVRSFVCSFFFVPCCFVLSQLEDFPSRSQYLCFIFSLFCPHPPNCLGLDGLQAFVAPPLTSHIFKAFLANY